MEKKEKRRRGDRRDAVLVRDLDSMHTVMICMMPNRADNEAYIKETIDLRNLEAYLERRNSEGPEHRYTIFQFILAALGRTIQMRPLMNRFIMGHRFYDRKHISFSLIAKKAFADDGAESVCILKYDPESGESPIDMMHKRLTDFVYEIRHENKTDNTTGIMDVIVKTGLVGFIMKLLGWMDRHGGMPEDIAKEDPYNSTVFISNLGSIRLPAGYHHLSNWGTNSVFVTVGEMFSRRAYAEDGSVAMIPSLEVGVTLDERIADGYYYSRTVRLFKRLMEEPELLDVPANEPLSVEY